MSSTETPTRVRGMISVPHEVAGKIATILWYLDQQRRPHSPPDKLALDTLLDDPQLAAWMERMGRADLINRTAFINHRR